MNGPIKSNKTNPLTILDMFLLTAFIAIFAGLDHNIRAAFLAAAEPGSDSNSNKLFDIISLLQALHCGVFCFLLYRMFRLRTFLVAPGHWLIVWLGINSLGQVVPLVFLTGVLVLDQLETDWVFSYYAGIQLVFSCLAWIVALVAAIKNKGYWRSVFIMSLIPVWLIGRWVAWYLAPNDLQNCMSLMQIFLALILPVTVYVDVKNHVERDWLHSVGVLLSAVHLFGWPIYFIAKHFLA